MRLVATGVSQYGGSSVAAKLATEQSQGTLGGRRAKLSAIVIARELSQVIASPN